jgi:hypothetical protein
MKKHSSLQSWLQMTCAWSCQPSLPCLVCQPRASAEAPPFFRRASSFGQDHHESNQLIITRASNLRHFESELLHAGTLPFDRNNHDGIADTLTSNARCRVAMHSSPDYQKLSTVLPKTRRCCRAVASTKASRCLSRRVSYSSYTSALPVASELSKTISNRSSLWKFATTTLADAASLQIVRISSRKHTGRRRGLLLHLGGIQGLE